jgi:uncharacterized protein (UPF0333 family)
MILKNISGNRMLQKLTPLIVLAMFAIGAYFMIQGMKNATDLAKPKKAKTIKETESHSGAAQI